MTIIYNVVALKKKVRVVDEYYANYKDAENRVEELRDQWRAGIVDVVFNDAKLLRE